MQHDANLAGPLVRELIQEKRSERRWKNIRFFLGWGLVIFLFLGVFFQSEKVAVYGDDAHGYVSLVRLEGLIAPGQDFSAHTVLPVLEEAFSDRKTKGVLLEINSGGGTPVQAAIIHDAILDLKKRYHKKVVVVGEDIMASGAYYVAVAADKIYVNPNSLTGSVGVIMKEFGFPELMKKIGVERRVYTSGANKDRLDPFLPQSPEDVKKIREVISEVHANFQAAVQAGRKGRLKSPPNLLFSGDFWSGQTAVKLGLVDKLGNVSDALKQEFNVGAFRDYSVQTPFLKSVMGQFGSELASGPLSVLTARVLEKV